MRVPSVILFLIVASAVSSCSKSKRDIALAPEMSAKVDAFLAEMDSIAESLPEEEFVKDVRLDPAPVFGREGEETNTLVSRVGQLRDLEYTFGFKDETQLDFFHGGRAQDFLHERYSNDEAPEGYEEDLNRFLDRPYVIAIDQESYEPPRVVNEDYFEGGTATIRAGLFDRGSGKWIVVTRIVSSAPDRVEFKATERDRQLYADQFVKGHLRGGILNEIESRLNEATGGKLDL